MISNLSAKIYTLHSISWTQIEEENSHRLRTSFLEELSPQLTKAVLPNAKMSKRKLDENDIPAEAFTHETQNSASQFADLKLDARLLRAVSKEKFTRPTPVQAEAIPLALAGKDILGLGLLHVQEMEDVLTSA